MQGSVLYVTDLKDLDYTEQQGAARLILFWLYTELR